MFKPHVPFNVLPVAYFTPPSRTDYYAIFCVVFLWYAFEGVDMYMCVSLTSWRWIFADLCKKKDLRTSTSGLSQQTTNSFCMCLWKGFMFSSQILATPLASVVTLFLPYVCCFVCLFVCSDENGGKRLCLCEIPPNRQALSNQQWVLFW